MKTFIVMVSTATVLAGCMTDSQYRASCQQGCATYQSSNKIKQQFINYPPRNNLLSSQQQQFNGEIKQDSS
jgi:tRNA U55 pseudouridine synthase TruB